jgi:hypothetical protein
LGFCFGRFSLGFSIFRSLVAIVVRIVSSVVSIAHAFRYADRALVRLPLEVGPVFLAAVFLLLAVEFALFDLVGDLRLCLEAFDARPALALAFGLFELRVCNVLRVVNLFIAKTKKIFYYN